MVLERAMRRSAVLRNPVGLAVTLAVAGLLLATLSGCGVVGRQGEGPLTTQERRVAAFTRIVSTDGIGVTVRVGEELSVVVSAQTNIMPIIATEVHENTLRIHGTEAFSTSSGVGVTVVMPAIAGIVLSGGSQGVVEGIDAERLDVNLDGAAVLTAGGVATAITLRASGGSSARMRLLESETVNLQVSGGANAAVWASNEVTGSADGGAQVTVDGGATLNVETSGGASVTRS